MPLATDKRGYPHNIFLISPRIHMLWYSLEAPCRGASNEYPQHMFSSRKKNVISIFQMKKSTLSVAMACILEFFKLEYFFLDVEVPDGGQHTQAESRQVFIGCFSDFWVFSSTTGNKGDCPGSMYPYVHNPFLIISSPLRSLFRFFQPSRITVQICRMFP